MPNKFVNLTGRVFGNLKILYLVSTYTADRHHSVWQCRCKCGIEFTKTASNILRGKNTGCNSCYRAHHKLRPFEALYNVLVKLAKARTTVSLTYAEFVKFTTINRCHYCDDKVVWKPYSTANGYKLDRRDNKVGYTMDNCVVCCARCNRSKSDHFSYDEWVLIGNLIRSWQK